jgi:anti-sigma factor RsiW
VTCQETTLALGVYLVGALDPSERAEVDEHLHHCAQCRAELAELAALPSMLDQLTIDDINAEPVTLPDDLFDRVAARARADDEADAPPAARKHRPRRAVLLAVAAVLAVFAAVGITVGTLVTHGQPSGYSATQAGIHMHVALTSQTSGTGLRVTVSGLPRNEQCRLIAVSSDGTRDLAGSWSATYYGQAQVTGSTVIPRSELSRLVLLGTQGQHLVTVPV